jgi:hypothetical protein
VQPLPAGDQLDAPEEQVEAVGVGGTGRVRVGVEGAFGHRIPGDEHEVRSVLAQRPLPDRTLVRRREIWLVRGGTGDLQRLGEVQRGKLGGHRGRQPGRTHHAADHLGEHGHDVAVILDEAELGVQRRVLGQVPPGLVRLGAEDRPHLVHALEDADHHLLVKLR